MNRFVSDRVQALATAMHLEKTNSEYDYNTLLTSNQLFKYRIFQAHTPTKRMS